MGVDSYYASPLLSKDDKLLGLVALMDDKPILEKPEMLRPIFGIFANRISWEIERTIAEEELKTMASVFTSSIEAVMISDVDNKILRINPAFSEIMGFKQDELINKDPSYLCFDEEDKTIYKNCYDLLLETGFWRGEICYRHKNNLSIPVRQTISMVRDEKGNIKHFIYIFNDISKEKEFNDQISYLANYDSLTGLINRMSFQKLLKKEIEQAKKGNYNLALLHFDLDNFKHINNIVGRSGADKVLIKVGHILTKTCNDKNYVTTSRISGDEFILLLKDFQDRKNLESIVLKVMQKLNNPILINQQDINISSCIGISCFPNDTADSEQLLKYADMAMKQAKASSKNSYFYFNENLNKQLEESIRIENDLKVALALDELSLYYQPQICLKSKKVVGFEALLRWKHPKKGMISPMIFIPIAEETGLILEIGDWVLNKACEDVKKLQAHYADDLSISINVSGRQFTQKVFKTKVLNALIQNKLEANQLELELTESIIMDDAEDNIKNLHDLRKLGVSLAVDDFGTGYSSMAYLKRFPLDKLKIDCSFTKDIVKDREDQAIVEATIALAHSLKLAVVAEGAEDLEQVNKLAKLGCDTIQGYYFGRPVPLDKTIDYLKEKAKEID